MFRCAVVGIFMVVLIIVTDGVPISNEVKELLSQYLSKPKTASETAEKQKRIFWWEKGIVDENTCPKYCERNSCCDKKSCGEKRHCVYKTSLKDCGDRLSCYMKECHDQPTFEKDRAIPISFEYKTLKEILDAEEVYIQRNVV